MCKFSVDFGVRFESPMTVAEDLLDERSRERSWPGSMGSGGLTGVNAAAPVG
jgi:hypothetical protein